MSTTHGDADGSTAAGSSLCAIAALSVLAGPAVATGPEYSDAASRVPGTRQRFARIRDDEPGCR